MSVLVEQTKTAAQLPKSCAAEAAEIETLLKLKQRYMPLASENRDGNQKNAWENLPLVQSTP